MRKAALLCAVVLLLTGVRSPSAQLDPSTRIYLYEEGVRVGEVYVPPREEHQTTYEEHWVLYAKYRYPGPNYLRSLVIKAEPTEFPYRDADDFFRRVPFGPHFTYIHITATESLTKAPIR
jgi:hypothetical protein